jgi:hypothetical protein
MIFSRNFFLFLFLTRFHVINLLRFQRVVNLVCLTAQNIFICLLILEQMIEVVYCYRLAIWDVVKSFGSFRNLFMVLLVPGHVLK